MRQLRLREKKLVALVAERTSQLNDANSALEDANRRLTELSHRDPLTGVANRRRFEDVLETEWRRAFRSGATVSLLMADVDSFKLYNDTHGHPEGDACLRCVAAAFQSGLKRASDLLARYGGEEFIVLLPDTEPQRAAALADDLRAGVQALGISHPGAPAAPVVTVSLGVAALQARRGWHPRRPGGRRRPRALPRQRARPQPRRDGLRAFKDQPGVHSRSTPAAVPSGRAPSCTAVVCNP